VNIEAAEGGALIPRSKQEKLTAQELKAAIKSP
jgi:hypothetical protein